MIVLCHLPDGKSLTFELSVDDVVEDLAVLVASHGYDTNAMRIQCQGATTPLELHKTFRDQGLTSEQLVVDVLTPPSMSAAGPAAAAAQPATTQPSSGPAAAAPQPATAQPSGPSSIERARALFGPPQQAAAPPTPAERARALFASPSGLNSRGVSQRQPPQPPQAARGPGHYGSPQGNFDPLDPEVQKRILEDIERRNVEENLQVALEHTPEAFVPVSLLYVRCLVNGVPIVAIIDTGAQMSCMSKAVAERCNILRLVDRNAKGTARGVGESTIVGRVHLTMVTLGNLVLPFSISVLDVLHIEFIIGVDQLKKHLMHIDLKRNSIVIEDRTVPLLTDKEVNELTTK